MRGREARAAVATLLAGVLTGCAANPAPRGWLAEPRIAERRAHGGWIELRCGRVSCGRGELIALEADRLVVLDEAGLRSVPIPSVTRATLAGYSTHAEALAVWGLFGTASTVSHGMFLILTVPLMWLPFWIGAPAEESRAALIRFPKQSWESFRPYARFPQGLPPDLDASALRLPAAAGDPQRP